MTIRIRPRARAAAALVLLSACSPVPPALNSPPSPAPPDVAIDPHGSAPSPPFRWPSDEGWYRLEVRIEVPAGPAAAQHADAISNVRWSSAVLEITVEAEDPADPTGSARRRRTVTDPSVADLAGLRSRFEQSLVAGLLDEGTGAWGGRRFRAIHTGPEGVVVTEIWEVGAGPAPWAPAS